MKKTLVVLAAGMGSRFGGLKQIEPVGPNGEFIIDYSVYDAIRSGFDKVIFIIKEENLEIFEETIGNRIKPFIELEYVFQDSSNLPIEIDLKGREKPLGTAHALYCAAPSINENFAIINADDFYGYGAIQKVAEFLDEKFDTEKEKYAVIGYKAINTITENGSVKRGVCLTEDGKLMGLDESTIELEDGKLYATSFKTEIKKEIEKDTLVSMNLLGFPESFLNHIKEEMTTFIEDNKDNIETCEYLIPDVISKQVENSVAEVEVIPTDEKWYGMTYKEDKDYVVNAIKNMIDEGIYKNNLWEKED